MCRQIHTADVYVNHSNGFFSPDQSGGGTDRQTDIVIYTAMLLASAGCLMQFP